MNNCEETNDNITINGHQAQECTLNQSNGLILEQDRFLPIANISRIMKRIIPSEGKLSKEAKECVQECITEFLLFITSEASERCAIEKRKTISGEDILTAFRTLGFDEYLTPLEQFLCKYREANKLQTTQAASMILHASMYASMQEQAQQQQMVEIMADPGQPIVYLQEQQLLNPESNHPVQVFYDAANGHYFIPVEQGGNDITQRAFRTVNIENAKRNDTNTHYQHKKDNLLTD